MASSSSEHFVAADAVTFADDFEGTAPDGSRYDKAEVLKPEVGVSETACRLDDAKVRLFGDVFAMAYGNERSTRKLQGQPEALRCLVWTDTWLKRTGKWEVIALVATTVALVLGLLVASAKSFYDTQNNEVTQLVANVVLLDRVLAHYGPEAADTRAILRDNAVRWSEVMQPVARADLRHRELLLDKIQDLSPKDDNQRAMKAQASNLTIQMGQVRWLMFEQSSVPVPKLLLFMLIFWQTVLFFSFGLFAPRNFTVKSGLFVAALAVAGAIFLILEMYHPYGGLIRVSDAPMQAALAQLGQ